MLRVLRQKERAGDRAGDVFRGMSGACLTLSGHHGWGGLGRRTQARASHCVTLGKSFPLLGLSVPSSHRWTPPPPPCVAWRFSRG